MQRSISTMKKIQAPKKQATLSASRSTPFGYTKSSNFNQIQRFWCWFSDLTKKLLVQIFVPKLKTGGGTTRSASGKTKKDCRHSGRHPKGMQLRRVLHFENVFLDQINVCHSILQLSTGNGPARGGTWGRALCEVAAQGKSTRSIRTNRIFYLDILTWIFNVHSHDHQYLRWRKRFISIEA